MLQAIGYWNARGASTEWWNHEDGGRITIMKCQGYHRKNKKPCDRNAKYCVHYAMDQVFYCTHHLYQAWQVEGWIEE